MTALNIIAFLGTNTTCCGSFRQVTPHRAVANIVLYFIQLNSKEYSSVSSAESENPRIDAIYYRG